jgi:hypothetical protein
MFSKTAFTLFLLSISLHAQLVNTTSLVGTVTDASGATVVGVTVTAINQETQETFHVETNNDGFYSFQFVKIGHYTITATHAGFETITTKDVQVDANSTVRTDFTLKVGQVSQQIEVTAANPPIATDNASVKEVVSEKSMTDLPLNGRDPLQLAITSPGVIQGLKAANGTPPGEDFIGAGTREIQNSISLDGISIVNNLITTTPVHPTVDTIQEFEVQTGTYTAQYGAYLGAHLNLLTKSGTNSLHGALWEFFRNSDLNARPYFLSPTSKKAPLHENQFGFELGGPLMIPKLYDGRNKTFLMGSYEGLRVVGASTSLATTLTDAMRAGNFSQLTKVLTYPGTKTPIPGNNISSMLSPQALAYLQWIPHANLPGATNNLAAVYPANDHWNQTIDRIDQNIGDKTRFFFRYAWIDEAILTGAANPYQSTTTPVSTRNWVIGYTQTITPNLVNDIHFGRQVLNTDSLNYWAVNNLTNAGTALGIPGFNADTVTGNPGLPILSISNYLGTGNGSTNWYQSDTTWQGTDSLTWTHGNHTIDTGLEFRKLITGREATNNSLGQFSFNGSYTGDAAADFMLGDALNDTTPAKQVNNTVAEWRDGFWVTDNWRASKRLTLDLGLRYELPTVPYTVNGYATILDPTLMTLLPANAPQRGFGLTSPNHKDFAPRVGLAYRITDKTVFRAGYGIYYNGNQTNSYTFLSQNPPFNFTAGYNSTAATIVTFANPTPAALVTSPTATPQIYSPATHQPTETMHQWSGDLQQSLWSGAALDLSYLGSHSLHLDRSYYVNTPQPGPGSVQPRRPLQQWGVVRIIQNDEDASYNGLSFILRQRLKHGLSFLSSYTWSHTLDASTDSNGGGTPMNPFNWHEDYSNANWDVRNRWITSFTYDLPTLAGSKYAVEKLILGGWHANGIFTMQSGFPFNVTTPNDTANTAASGSYRPNVIYPYSANCGDGRLVNCINIQDYQLPNTYAYGNAGRNMLYGPGLRNLDFSLLKSFALYERLNLQFRFETFNLANHPNFSNPSAGLPSLATGVYNYTSPGSFGNITSTSNNMRTLQLALKLVF